MKVAIQDALTSGNCTGALINAQKLYLSVYTDNEVRMLYASAQACAAGINMYTVYQNITSLGGANPIGAIVGMFPSATDDSKAQSAGYALDALQTIITPGTVVGSVDQTVPDAFNSGSVVFGDMTENARVYALFVTMANVGTLGNRYGNPDASNNQQADFTWTTKALVQADSTGYACQLASSFLVMLDSFAGVATLLPSGPRSAVDSAATLLGAVDTAGYNVCHVVNGFSDSVCKAAGRRLRNRASCIESDQIASYAAGVITGINAGWL